MKTPLFWNKKSIKSYLLLPLAYIYYMIYKIRCLINKTPYKSKIKVICIGNIVVGGAGKTPIAIEVAKICKENNKKFCFLSKGYGGNFKDVLKLDKNSTSEIVGDEPLLLFKYGDVFVSKNRINGLKYIENNFNYDYIIVDDGLQNPTFYKDKIILVIDGNFGFGNGFILPAGPLRETFKNVYKKTDLVIINNKINNYISNLCKQYNVKNINTNIVIDNIDELKNKEFIAFCGIGRPEKFKQTLIDNDIKIKDFIIFEDHYKYKDVDIEKMLINGYNLITTTKDYVKINDKYKNKIYFVDIHIELNKKELMDVIYE